MLLDGELVCACLVGAGQADGRLVLTVEGLGDGDHLDRGPGGLPGRPGAVQCGFCTPGLVVATHDLLRANPSPTDAEIREALAGNLCRCTGYEKILDAVRLAASATGAAMSTVVGPPRVDDRLKGGVGLQGGVGADVRRPDGPLKVTGRFAFSSDLWAEDMIWGATVRSPHPRAVIAPVDASDALRIPGVRCVLTHEDVPGRKTYGLEVADQPVLAIDQVRYQGEPVAIVAADDPETARRAAAAVQRRVHAAAARPRPGPGAEARLRPGPPGRQRRPPCQGAPGRPVRLR